MVVYEGINGTPTIDLVAIAIVRKENAKENAKENNAF